MTAAMFFALVWSTYHLPVVVLGVPADTGMGKCKMDQHWHNSDAACHRDSDDSIVHVLPKVNN